jgi:hypothetical protein
MNRHTEWAIIYSPQDKDNISKNYQTTLITLTKNCTKFLVQYEEGKNETNPHLDIVAQFKSKQSKNDLTKKLGFLGTKPAVVYSVIKDWKYRIGYNQKEQIDSPYNHNNNIPESEITESIQHYEETEIERKKTKAKYNLFTYIKESTFAYEFNKYIINNEIEPPTEQDKYESILKQMYLEGYIFTCIKRHSLQMIGRQIIHTYRKKANFNYSLEKTGQMDLLSLTDLDSIDVTSPDTHKYCPQCSSNF